MPALQQTCTGSRGSQQGGFFFFGGGVVGIGCHSQVGKDTELDAVARQFEPYLKAGCACTGAPLWCGLGCVLEQSWLRKLRRSNAL